jgi:hypothetical protein
VIRRDKDTTLKTLLIQEALKARGFDPGPLDNWWGEQTQSAYQAFLNIEAQSGQHQCVASIFADDKDLAAFRRCKAEGRSDEDCFAEGDNGVGAWGADTAQDQDPMVALPPEDIEERWGSKNAGRSKTVIVTYKEKSVRARLEDLMPHKANIQNGAGIDLNPATVKALGIPDGGMVQVTWAWA